MHWIPWDIIDRVVTQELLLFFFFMSIIDVDMQ